MAETGCSGLGARAGIGYDETSPDGDAEKASGRQTAEDVAASTAARRIWQGGKEMKKESMIKLLLDQMNEQQFRNYLDIISSYGMARFGISVVVSDKNVEETT